MTRLVPAGDGSLVTLLLMSGTPPSQPRHDRATDRAHSARTDADHDAPQLVAADLIPCHIAVEHIAVCVECRSRLFEAFVKAYDPETWTEEQLLRAS